jgi:hypothetical protein
LRGVLILAVFLYVVLSGQSKVLALVALTCWLAEALAYVLGQIGTTDGSAAPTAPIANA